MITKELVQKYLAVKEMFEKCKITGERYTELIIRLCCEYQVGPEKLAEYNMDLEPRKFKMG